MNKGQYIVKRVLETLKPGHIPGILKIPGFFVYKVYLTP